MKLVQIIMLCLFGMISFAQESYKIDSSYYLDFISGELISKQFYKYNDEGKLIEYRSGSNITAYSYPNSQTIIVEQISNDTLKSRRITIKNELQLITDIDHYRIIGLDTILSYVEDYEYLEDKIVLHTNDRLNENNELFRYFSTHYLYNDNNELISDRDTNFISSNEINLIIGNDYEYLEGILKTKYSYTFRPSNSYLTETRREFRYKNGMIDTLKQYLKEDQQWIWSRLSRYDYNANQTTEIIETRESENELFEIRNRIEEWNNLENEHIAYDSLKRYGYINQESILSQKRSNIPWMLNDKVLVIEEKIEYITNTSLSYKYEHFYSKNDELIGNDSIYYLNLYPNPISTNENFNIESNINDFDFEIYNEYGNLVDKGAIIDQNSSFRVPSVPGIYFLNFIIMI